MISACEIQIPSPVAPGVDGAVVAVGTTVGGTGVLVAVGVAGTGVLVTVGATVAGAVAVASTGVLVGVAVGGTVGTTVGTSVGVSVGATDGVTVGRMGGGVGLRTHVIDTTPSLSLTIVQSCVACAAATNGKSSANNTATKIAGPTFPRIILRIAYSS